MFIPINKPWLDEREKAELLAVLEENALTSAAFAGGKRVQEFESLVRQYLNVKHVIAVNSGTAALHAALLAAGIKRDDEVLLPSFTFVATANAIVAAGAKPVFVDINKNDYTISIGDLRSKITPKTKAIIPVHLYGHPCNMNEIMEIANDRRIDVIEDACQSLGSRYRKQQTGTIGSAGCFSLYASKVLTSGEGGMVVTNRDDIAENVRMIRNHGMVEGYDTRILGLNLRLPELNAAIAKIQMSKLSKMLTIRKRNAELMTSLLREKKEQIILPAGDTNREYNWYLYTISFVKKIRDEVQNKMNQKGIGATVYYDPPVHQTPFYSRTLPSANLPITEWTSKNVLSLPVHPFLDETQIQLVANTLRDCL